MRKILSLVLIISMIFGTALPLTAMASTETDSATPTSAADEPLDDSGIADNGGTDGDSILGQSGDGFDDGALPFDPIYENTEDGGFISIMPLSGFEDLENEFYTKIRLTVTDRYGNRIQGAVYGLYRADNDQLVELLTTDRYGVVTSVDVPVDKDYYLLEYSTPEGFTPNYERKDIILSEVCAPSRVDVTAVYDPIMGNIKVVKQDEYGSPISGVGFYVYRVDGWELVDTIYTDQNGEAYTTGLPYGGYEFYEFYAPEDFVTGGYYTGYITYDGETETLYITNYRATGSARIYKTGNDERKVQGAVYSIHRIGEGDELICDITTNANGYAYAYDLPMGEYYAVEKSVPSPYVLNDTPQYFTFSNNGEWAYLDFVNEVAGESGRLRVLKTDDSNDPLSGVVFGLYRAWDNKKLAELTTGSTGIAEYYPLIPQDYYLLELTGKPGYTMLTDRISFTVDGSGETVELTVENPKIRIFGKVKVIKKDDAGSPIPGIHIGVYCKYGNLLEELVTGDDGTATSGILNEGSDYYLVELGSDVSGYILSTEQHAFDITTNGSVVSVEIVNLRISGGLRVLKYGDGEEPLAGVTFGIYRDGRLVERLTTQEDGAAESGVLYYGDYELIELSTVEGYELIDTPIPFSITEDGVVLELTVTNPLIMGTITVIKVDDVAPEVANREELIAASLSSNIVFGNRLSGAVFGIYNKQGQKLAEITTGEDGTASYALPKGEYFLKELVPPEGFLLTDELIPFAIDTQGQVVEKVVVNTQGFGAVKVIKTDGGEDAVFLPGVAFDVFSAITEEKVGELLTDEQGESLLELPLGRYFLVETATVEGFQFLNGRVSFALTQDSVTVELPIANQRIPAPENGGINLTKKCAETDALLPNAVFGVFNADTDERVGAMTTNASGTASISLPAGAYYLLEEVSPTGFRSNAEKIPVIVESEAYTSLTVENQPEDIIPGTLRVIKNAKGTGERLPDAVFDVYDAVTDDKVAEITTNENGVATATLCEGDFYLIELTPPAGFQKLAEPISFHITSGETLRLNIANDPIEEEPTPTGTVRFIKKNEDGNRLSGAVIGIYRVDTDKKIAELTTDSKGVAEYNLAEGAYYWKELRAPEGFVLLEGSNPFQITADSTKEIVVVNKALPNDTGTLLLIKKAAGTGERIADAVFGVYTTSGNRKVAEITTDDDGEASIGLEPGSYYLRELSVPSPFVPEAAKISFTIKTVGATVTIEASNTKGVGKVLLEKKDPDGKAVSGAVFTLYRSDGTRIAELTSGQDGTASYELPVGTGYYLVEKTAAVGFKLDTTRHGFDIRHGEISTVKAVNVPLTGTVEVYFKHTSDGRELANMKELTAKIGTDYIKWMRENGYENMAIPAFTLIRTDYPTSLVIIEGKLVVTLWYSDPATPGGPTIDIPKTGGAFPAMTFALSALCWLVASFCAVTLVRGRKQTTVAMAGIDTIIPKLEQEPKPPRQTGSQKAQHKGGKKRRR